MGILLEQGVSTWGSYDGREYGVHRTENLTDTSSNTDRDLLARSNISFTYTLYCATLQNITDTPGRERGDGEMRPGTYHTGRVAARDLPLEIAEHTAASKNDITNRDIHKKCTSSNKQNCSKSFQVHVGACFVMYSLCSIYVVFIHYVVEERYVCFVLFLLLGRNSSSLSAILAGLSDSAICSKLDIKSSTISAAQIYD